MCIRDRSRTLDTRIFSPLLYQLSYLATMSVANDSSITIPTVSYTHLEQGGVPVLAHPGQKDSWSAIPDLIACGLMGIEAYHPSHTPEDVDLSLIHIYQARLRPRSGGTKSFRVVSGPA